MNPNTRVAVCCYAGDLVQVTGALELYLHHECPVTILSPTDAKVEIQQPGIESRFGGKRAYTGQASADRQREHLKLLLECPEDFFLVHDSDSVCLSPEIPAYLYSEDVLWSNLVVDNMPGREHGYYIDGFPSLAFQPPYFFSRKVLEQLLASVAAENLPVNPTLPFIDHYMVQLAVKAAVPGKNFRDGITGPISSDRNSFSRAWEAAQRGVVMIHSVKAPAFWQPLVAARKLYLEGVQAPPPPMPSPMSWSREQHRDRSAQMQTESRIARDRSGQALPVVDPLEAGRRLRAQRRAVYLNRRGQA